LKGTFFADLLLEYSNYAPVYNLYSVILAEQKVLVMYEHDSLQLTEKSDMMEVSGHSPPPSIRVDVGKLDLLMDLIGELAIAKTMLAQNPDLDENDVTRSSLDKLVLRLDRITREIQEVVTSIRMVPLKSEFRRMVRLVRDLAHRSQKQVEIRIIGEEVEIDRAVGELIRHPLMHIIRNAIDHGLETPEERKAVGKSTQGYIILEAENRDHEIWISIRDDGKGLDRDKILKKAREKGLMRDDCADLRDEDVWQFIFQPGFSTVDDVTTVSGRGVGMDVVRRNLQTVSGRAEVRSKPGKGTIVTLRIPITRQKSTTKKSRC
jgi:two-component system chemotaxis sensor kinase CheA